MEVEKYLNGKYGIVEKIEDTYKSDYGTDIFFSYYEGDRKAMNKLGMEEKGKLDHRFDAWFVRK